jgi:hypothetical protein
MRQREGDAPERTRPRDGACLPPPLSLSLNDVPLGMVMPSLKQIVNREVTREEHDRAIVLDALQRVKR